MGVCMYVCMYMYVGSAELYSCDQVTVVLLLRICLGAGRQISKD